MSEKENKPLRLRSPLSEFGYFVFNTLICFSEFVFVILHWGFLFNLVSVLQQRLVPKYATGMFTWELIPLYAVIFMSPGISWLPHYKKIVNTHLFLHTLQYIQVLITGPPDFSDTNVPCSVKFVGMLYASIDTLVHTSVVYRLFVASKKRGNTQIYGFVLGLLLAHAMFMAIEGQWFTVAYEQKMLR